MAVPAATPVTTPELAFIVAKELVVDHVPPPLTSLNVMVEFTHTAVAPAMEAGAGFTVTAAIALHAALMV